MTTFGEKVKEVVRGVPRGRVVSYGQVAAYMGVPRGARIVGWVLRQTDGPGIPWWRVINNAGRISIKNMRHEPDEQRDLLRVEGVEVGEDFGIDIEKYRFVANEEQMRQWGLPEEYLQLVWERFARGY